MGSAKVGAAVKVEDREGKLVSMAGQGGNRGGVESQACGVAAKPTVMLATGTGCCGPQVVLVCTSKGQAVNMKTQLISPHLPHLSPLLHSFFLWLLGSLFVFFPTRGTSKVLQHL